MNLAILDGYTLNPGDLSWAPLSALATCRIFDRTAVEEIAERAAGAEMVLTTKVPFSRRTLDKLSALQYIGVTATGYNIIDLEAAAERGIAVTNVPTYSTASVAQGVFSLILELYSRTGQHSEAVHRGAWTASRDWCFRLGPLRELCGKRLGIVGYGRIGGKVAQIARAFDMEVIACGRRPPAELPEGIAWSGLDEVFARADIVSLHCPLLPSTRGMVDGKRISTMKPDAVLVNTARGGLVVEKDLAEALNCGRLAGAAMDVLDVEPPPEQNPLLSARNCVITPHIAWATNEARERLLRVVVANVAAWLKGEPQNLVNAPA